MKSKCTLTISGNLIFYCNSRGGNRNGNNKIFTFVMKSWKILPGPALVATGHEDLLTFTQFWKMITSSDDRHKGAFDDHHKVLEVFDDHQLTDHKMKLYSDNKIQRQQGL